MFWWTINIWIEISSFLFFRLTLLSPRFATYRTSSTTSIHVAVEPSFHAGFLQTHTHTHTHTVFSLRFTSFQIQQNQLKQNSLAGGFLQEIFISLTEGVQQTLPHQLLQVLHVTCKSWCIMGTACYCSCECDEDQGGWALPLGNLLSNVWWRFSAANCDARAPPWPSNTAKYARRDLHNTQIDR